MTETKINKEDTAVDCGLQVELKSSFEYTLIRGESLSAEICC